jgi:hypothetical protein
MEFYCVFAFEFRVLVVDVTEVKGLELFVDVTCEKEVE